MNEENQSPTTEEQIQTNFEFVEMREHTTIETSKGNISVIHEITLGDMILSTILISFMIFYVLDRLIRR